MATTFGSPASRADQTLAWNMQLIGHHELSGFGGVGEGMAIQQTRDGRRILWLAHESAPKNFTAIDVTDPRQLKQLVQTDLPHARVRSNSLDVVGDIMTVAYQTKKLGAKPAGFDLFDISKPEQPKLISHFDASRIPEGITASRYPSDLGQYIPTFSLIWVAMVHDYWMHRDDLAYVRSMLPGIRGVLAWYESYVDQTGLLGPMPWWSFVDWAKEWPVGIPPGAKDGHSAMITLQFAYALQRGAELEDALGLPSEGARYRALAGKLTAAARAKAWDPARSLFLDSPEAKLYSQQANTMAVLVDAVPASEQRALMERVLEDRTLVQSTYYYSFYVLEALRKAGLADRYIEQLAPWRAMLALGLTTTAESPEPTRSDSHAWSAHPNYGLLATVLGIRPASPGFKAVRIAPSLGPLKRAAGRMPHPLGDIDVRLERSGDQGLRGEVTLPPGLSGTFEWNGRQLSLRPGRQEIGL
jgi:hypothetical protein